MPLTDSRAVVLRSVRFDVDTYDRVPLVLRALEFPHAVAAANARQRYRPAPRAARWVPAAYDACVRRALRIRAARRRAALVGAVTFGPIGACEVRA